MFETNLKKLRMNKELSQAKLAEEIGTLQQMIWKWEAGLSTPNPTMLKKLANFFNVSVDYLLDNESTEKKAPPLPRNIQKVVDAMNRVDDDTSNRMLIMLETAFPDAFEEQKSQKEIQKYSYEWALNFLQQHDDHLFAFAKESNMSEEDVIKIAKNLEK